ncbi:hypothetical protein BGX31_002638 [Mortierella sp. GBA43]|nr:hypothetical protein BGX31_002638 [Mortierella sp. GBA43]
MPMQASIRQSVTDIYSLTESPVDERDASSHRQTILGTTRGYDPYDMESYPEPDDAQESEDEHEDDDGMGNHAKKQKLGASYSRPLPYNNAPFSRNSQYVGIEQNESNIATEQPSNNMGSVEEEHGEEYGNPEMMTGVCTQGISVNAHGDERPQRKTRKPKNTAQKRGSRRTSLPTSHGDPNDQIDGDGHAGIEPPLAGRGLRIYAQRVCEQVKDKGSTSYNELVHDLFGGNLDENVDNAPETTGQENIRRRVYDALNVLNAIDIIRFENKDIRWVGAERSEVIHKVTRSAQGEPPEDGGDDESEEPEDDDMEIDKLQREVDAMRLRNQLEQAKLQDQLTRQVSLLNLVKRNKRREEREARRRQPREERRRTTGDMDASMTDTGAQGASDHNDEARKKSERRRRRQSRRRHLTERPEGQMGETSMVDMEADLEDEEARRRRRQERRERRERKEKQRSERIQLPFVIVRMPGYTSSDSESSISVVRSVKSRKGKQATQSPGQEMTMVEIQIPQQEELGIMSDTEILGELGLNTVTMDELETMLPKDLMDAVQYTINDETPRMDSLRNQRPTEAGHSHRSVNGNPVVAEDDASAAASITVHGGFERQIVRAASESASSVA